MALLGLQESGHFSCVEWSHSGIGVACYKHDGGIFSIDIDIMVRGIFAYKFELLRTIGRTVFRNPVGVWNPIRA